MLVKPGLESTGRPDLSILVSQLSSSLVDFWMAVESFRDVSKSFPKLFTGWSLMEDMIVRCNQLFSLFQPMAVGCYFPRSDPLSEIVTIIQDEVLILLGTWWRCNARSTNLCGIDPYALAKSATVIPVLPGFSNELCALSSQVLQECHLNY